MRSAVLGLVFVAVVATGIPAFAMIPVIDIGAIQQEIANVAQTAQVVTQTTQVVTQAKQLVVSAETSLRSLNPQNFGNVLGQINSIPNQGRNIVDQSAAQFRGVLVANAITTSAQNTAAQAQATNTQAQVAVGPHSDAQVTNETLASIRDNALLQTNLAASQATGAFVGNVQGATAVVTLEQTPVWTP